MAPESDPKGSAALAALRSQYQDLLQRLESNQSEFQRLGRAVYRVQEDERRRIARELHDGIGQNLTGVAASGASEGRHAGLSDRRERARLYGGDVQIESGANTGTWLRASVPLLLPAHELTPA